MGSKAFWLMLLCVCFLAGCKARPFTDRDACAKVVRLMGADISQVNVCVAQVRESRQEIDRQKDCIEHNDSLDEIQACMVGVSL